jgi:hypothetical protein
MSSLRAWRCVHLLAYEDTSACATFSTGTDRLGGERGAERGGSPCPRISTQNSRREPGSSRNAVRLPFGISVRLRRNPHLEGPTILNCAVSAAIPIMRGCRGLPRPSGIHLQRASPGFLLSRSRVKFRGRRQGGWRTSQSLPTPPSLKSARRRTRTFATPQCHLD